ncbi:hypothetical protein FA13DRAFT_1806817 [Coprinellus micaceus]|uniref:F-box domain-containing protein n=1 Tax=Coprinellus micaceus TaxID=71717 RepID=A0A4Y7RJ32_COPMI|nr:hypothetical protein FA13DRAFT_1806817 [Coprinellus micaceus]
MDQRRLDQLSSSNSSLHPLELSLLRSDVKSREEAIERLETQLQALKSQCQARKVLLAPLRRSVLPPELLGEIFYRTLKVSKVETSRQVVDMCLVCKAWRDAALTTPSLWVEINIRAEGRVEFPKVNIWLSRSGIIPKKLSIDASNSSAFPRSGCPLSSPELAHMLTAGLPLKSLSLKCDYPRCFNNLFAMSSAIETTSPRPWDTLESLNVDCDYSWDDWGGSGLDFFPLLPQSLSSLSIHIPDPDFLPMGASPPEPPSFLSLSTLLIQCEFPVAWMLKTLESCPNLENVTLDFNNSCPKNGDEVPFGGDVRSFPKYRAFKLYGLYYPYVDSTEILCFLSMPSLVELHIGFECWSDEVADLDMPEIGSNIVQFSNQSNVTHLILEDIEIHDGYPIIEDLLLPRLQVLEVLNFPDGDEYRSQSLYAFIEKRSPRRSLETAGNPSGTIASIQQAKISIPHQKRPSADDSRYMERLKEGGVDFTLTFS